MLDSKVRKSVMAPNLPSKSNKIQKNILTKKLLAEIDDLVNHIENHIEEINADEVRCCENELDLMSISLEAEVPEALYVGMKDFISGNEKWDQSKLISSAIANFLFQNGSDDRAVAEKYLNDIFNLASQ